MGRLLDSNAVMNPRGQIRLSTLDHAGKQRLCRPNAGETICVEQTEMNGEGLASKATYRFPPFPLRLPIQGNLFLGNKYLAGLTGEKRV